MSRTQAIFVLCTMGAFVGTLMATLDPTLVETVFLWLTGFALALSITGASQ